MNNRNRIDAREFFGILAFIGVLILMAWRH